MKVNIISEYNTRYAPIDFEVFNFVTKKLKTNVEINMISSSSYSIDKKASINFYINSINRSFFNSAKTNVLLVDHTIVEKSVLEYLPLFDYVFVKDTYTGDVLKSLEPNANYVNIGWDSPNISDFSTTKCYDKILMYVSNLKDDIYKQVLNMWEDSFYPLHVYGSEKITNRPTKDNIVYHDNSNNDEFHKDFNSIVLHLIPEKYNGYSHLVNQCKQVGNIPICLATNSNREIVSEDFGYFIPVKKIKNKNYFMAGPGLSVNIDNVRNVIDRVCKTNVLNHEYMCRDSKVDYKKLNNKFSTLFKDKFNEIISLTREKPKYKEENIKDDELPTVSIITPTFNRKNFFRLPILNYNSFNYPREKLEWIIIDDSDKDQSVDDLLPPEDKRSNYNIRYVRHFVENTNEGETEKVKKRSNDLLSIGEKRNMGVDMANNQIIVFMDDDDYYYPDYIRNRVSTLNTMNKLKGIRCVGCTSLGVLEINRIISMVYTPPMKDAFSSQISINSLVFYKDFHDENHKFEDTSFGECEPFVNGRIKLIEVLDWEKNIITLAHDNNIRNIQPPRNQKTNGSHYNLGDKLFKFIISLGKDLKETEEK